VGGEVIRTTEGENAKGGGGIVEKLRITERHQKKPNCGERGFRGCQKKKRGRKHDAKPWGKRKEVFPTQYPNDHLLKARERSDEKGHTRKKKTRKEKKKKHRLQKRRGKQGMGQEKRPFCTRRGCGKKKEEKFREELKETSWVNATNRKERRQKRTEKKI